MQDYEIDGAHFSTLEGFCAEVWPLLAGYKASGTANLDAFNDILSWPDEPYLFVWKNFGTSQLRLNHQELSRKLERILETCHETARDDVKRRLEQARAGQGPTMCDWLVEIIRDNAQYVTLLTKD